MTLSLLWLHSLWLSRTQATNKLHIHHLDQIPYVVRIRTLSRRLAQIDALISGADVINKLEQRVTMLRWNKALWLAVPSHVTILNQ